MARRKLPPETEVITEATETIAAIIDRRRDEREISPAWVATEAMTKLNAAWMLRSKRGHPTVYRLAHLQCRQIARAMLREFFEPEEDASKVVHPLFPDLQWRYPVARSAGDEPVYVKTELMTREDWLYNVARLRADAASRQRHADALEVWGASRFAARA